MIRETVFFECNEHLYLVKDDAANAFKVGRGSDVPARMRDLQCGNPNELRLVCTWEHAGFLEPLFHRLFKGYRIRNEWYPHGSVPVEMLLEWTPVVTDVASLLESFGAAMYRTEREQDVLSDPWAVDPELWTNFSIPDLDVVVEETSKARDEHIRRVANVTAVRDAKLAELRDEDPAIYAAVQRERAEMGVANG